LLIATYLRCSQLPQLRLSPRGFPGWPTRAGPCAGASVGSQRWLRTASKRAGTLPTAGPIRRSATSPPAMDYESSPGPGRRGGKPQAHEENGHNSGPDPSAHALEPPSQGADQSGSESVDPDQDAGLSIQGVCLPGLGFQPLLSLGPHEVDTRRYRLGLHSLTVAGGTDIDPGQKGYGRVGVHWP
jgi:hypothetical protein